MAALHSEYWVASWKNLGSQGILVLVIKTQGLTMQDLERLCILRVEVIVGYWAGKTDTLSPDIKEASTPGTSCTLGVTTSDISTQGIIGTIYEGTIDWDWGRIGDSDLKYWGTRNLFDW